jgi:hypothetical protein
MGCPFLGGLRKTSMFLRKLRCFNGLQCIQDSASFNPEPAATAFGPIGKTPAAER